MKERIWKLLEYPFVAHAMAANNRFTRRLGPQFAAAVTYFSVLSLGPVLMFGVAILGFSLTVLRPDWLALVRDAITSELGDTDVARSISAAVENALFNWRSIIFAALLTGGYAGSKWIGNLKKAFRVMWRPRFADAAPKHGFLRELVENLFIFFGLLVSLLVAFAVTYSGGVFSSHLIQLLGLQGVPGIGWLVRGSSVLLLFLASWLLFAFLFAVLPGQATSMRVWLVSTLGGALGVTLLQQLAGLLVGVFSRNATAQIFGTTIVLVLMLNLLSITMLMVAAWVGTDETWPEWLAQHRAERGLPSVARDRADEVDVEGEPRESETAGEGQLRGPSGVVLPRDPGSWAEKRRLERLAGTMTAAELSAMTLQDLAAVVDTADAPPVPQKVAARSVRVGLGVGWGVGAATGIGLGAAIAALAGRIARR